MDEERVKIIADEMSADHHIFGKKITYRFLVVIFIVSVFILVTGMVGTESLRKVWLASHTFATKDVPTISNLYTLEEVTTRLTYYLDIIVRNSDQKISESAKDKFIEYEKSGQMAIENLERTIVSPEERLVFEEALKSYYQFIGFARVFVDDRETTIGDISYQDALLSANQSRREAQDDFFKLAHLSKKRIAENAATLSETHSKMRQNLFFLTLFGLFLATIAGILLGRKAVIGPALQVEAKASDYANLNKELNSSNKMLIERDIQLSEVNRRLKEIDANRAEFVSIVAHQLRTPLAGIKWTLDMLVHGDMGEMTPEQKSHILKLLESNERMIRFVTDLLSISRIESGRLEYKFEPVNIGRIAEGSILDIYPISNEKQITINYRGKGLMLPQIAADTDKIRAVFQNILENAVKYSPNGSRITMDIRSKGSEILVSIADEGPGIPKDEQKNIFKRFYRAPSAVKVHSEGSGLGLYLAKAIIEGHNGKIWFESEAGKGTTFYFSLPVPHKT